MLHCVNVCFSGLFFLTVLDGEGGLRVNAGV